MAKKNVTIFRVELAGIDEFSQILLNPDFYSAIELDSLKTTELKFVEKNPNGTITGLFVTTQKKEFHQHILLVEMTTQLFH